ncbi:MAG TPA: hypothetical protein VFT51_00475 [Bacillales bacterium]|nr:hypothetical protein [Bacillales bacterium]
MQRMSRLLSEAIVEKQSMERQKAEIETRILAVEQKIKNLRAEWLGELQHQNSGYHLTRD